MAENRNKVVVIKYWKENNLDFHTQQELKISKRNHNLSLTLSWGASEKYTSKIRKAIPGEQKLAGYW